MRTVGTPAYTAPRVISGGSYPAVGGLAGFSGFGAPAYGAPMYSPAPQSHANSILWKAGDGINSFHAKT